MTTPMTTPRTTPITTLSRRRFTPGALAALIATALPLAAFAQSGSGTGTPSGRNKVVFQITDADPGRWNIVLNNMGNLQSGMSDDPPEVELVVYGPAVTMLKSDSPVASRIGETVKSGAKIAACENTMRNMKLTHADMLPEIGYVPAGVVEVVRKQQQGWAYVRP